MEVIECLGLLTERNKNAQTLKFLLKKHIWETLRNDTLWSRPLEDPSIVKQKEIAQLR
jgi:hypothetical protein